jgi:hypothetical protein
MRAMRKFGILILAVLGLATMVLLAAPGLVMIGLWLLIIPGLILSIIPTLFFYALLFTLVFWLSHRFRWIPDDWSETAKAGVGALIGIFAVILGAVGLPLWINSQLDASYSRAFKSQKQLEKPLSPAQVFRLESSRERELVCSDLCLALLYEARVKEVQVARIRYDSRGKFAEVAARRPLRVVLQNQCSVNSGGDRQWEGGDQDLRVWFDEQSAAAAAQSARLKALSGECLVSGAKFLAEPDVRIREVKERVGFWTTTPIDTFYRRSNGLNPWSVAEVRVQGVELLAGDQLVARITPRIQQKKLTVPLWLKPDGPATSTSWHWEWSSSSPEAKEIQSAELLSQLTGYSLHRPSTGTPDIIRAELDQALADQERPAKDMAFSLIHIYSENLDRYGFQKSDPDRISRWIADPRTSEFSYRLVAKMPLRDRMVLYRPLMTRLLELHRLMIENRPKEHDRQPTEEERIQSERFSKYSNTSAKLMELVAYLPPDVFESADPMVDELLSDPKLLTNKKLLISTLALRHPQQVHRLLDIIQRAWNTPTDEKSKRRAREEGMDIATAASNGICYLGVAELSTLQKQTALQQAQELELRGLLPAHFVRSDSWSGALVSLGADPEKLQREKSEGRIKRSNANRWKSHLNWCARQFHVTDPAPAKFRAKKTRAQ